MGRPLRLLLSLLIAGVLLAILFSWTDVNLVDVAEAFRQLPTSVYVKAMLVHLGIYVLRAARFRVLLPPSNRPGFFALLAVSSSHNLAAYVLPAKTGEGTLVLYLRNVCGVPAGEGLASLVVSRLLDLATLALLLSVATLWLGTRGTLAVAWSYPLGGVLGAGAVALFLLSARSVWLVRTLTWFVRNLRLDGTRIGRKVTVQADGVAQAFHAAGGAGRLRLAAVLSIPLWMGVFLFYLVLARGFGLGEDLNAIEATFASAWAVLANLLPINGFAGAGTQELGWVVGFTTVGVDEAAATTSGLGAHLVQLLNVVLFGFIGHALMALTKSSSSSEDAS